MKLSDQEMEEVIGAVSTWMRIYQDNRGDNPRFVDAEHSALLRRLLSGKKPLPIPPPRSFSYPSYALAEGQAVHVEFFEDGFVEDDGYSVVVNQHRDYKWVRENVLVHKNGMSFQLDDVQKRRSTNLVVAGEATMTRIS